MPITRHLSALTLATVALGLPAGAQAAPSASVHGSVTAAADAGVHVEQAQQLAARAQGSSQAKVQSLLQRSRAELRSATRQARELAAQADSSPAFTAAIRANTVVSAAVEHDAEVLAEIALDAKPSLQNKLAAALVVDMQKQKQLLKSTMDMVSRSGDEAEATLQGVQAVQANAGAEITTTAELAGAPIRAKAKASADLAVALGTQMLAATAQNAKATKTSLQSSAAEAMDAFQQKLRETAAQVSTTIADNGIADNEVSVAGSGNMSLGTLARMNVEASASASTNGTADARVSGAFGTLTRR